MVLAHTIESLEDICRKPHKLELADIFREFGDTYCKSYPMSLVYILEFTGHLIWKLSDTNSGNCWTLNLVFIGHQKLIHKSKEKIVKIHLSINITDRSMG